MAWFVGQSLLIILSAFLLGLLVGWLWWGRRPAKSSGGKSSTAAAGMQDRTVPIIGLPEPVESEPAAAASVAAEPAEAQEIEPVAAAPLAVEPVVDEPVDSEPVDSEPAVEAAAVETAAAETAAAETAAAETAAAETAAAETAAAEPAAEPVATEEVVVVPAARKPAKKAAKKAVPAQAVPGEDGVVAVSLPTDDLKRIEGIGPKMSAALHTAGIRTYVQLSLADEQTLRDAIEAAGLKFAPSLLTWARQAQLLADGDEPGFTDLTRRLVAGRDTGRS